MRWLALILCATPALACEDPICEVPEGSLRFTRRVDFSDLPSSYGIGRNLDGLVVGDGVQFGEHFLGQGVEISTGHDRLSGRPTAPLTLVAGVAGANLGTLNLWGDNIVQGMGPKGFPDAGAVGEGAIAVLFDEDQPALALDVRGGEGGTVTFSFYRRDGAPILRMVRHVDRDTGTIHVVRQDLVPDIAGFSVENQDPEGLGIDNLQFLFEELMGRLGSARTRG
ncbi:hypothetical protein [Salipiger sp.]|uniref:hypothetical protein n=1 Tax=Salipiger sp. TaxID=2078585 RepID=UPI003A97880E